LAPPAPARPERARLFVALDLPEAVRERLAAWSADRLSAVSGLRLIDRRYLHVTLCFLGWRDVGEVGEIAAACRAAAPPDAFPLSLGEALWLPPRRPRVVAVQLPDPSGGLARLQAAVSAALAARGFYEPESRPYLGHVTVGRVGRGHRVRAQELAAPEPLGFDAEGVTLYRSRLERGGARYEALETVPLG
jgi:RNA 2',3'-cyclic 3'-phosphodiesterase